MFSKQVFSICCFISVYFLNDDTTEQRFLLGLDLSVNRICAKKSDSVWLLHVSSLSHLPVWTLTRGPLPVRGRWTVTTGNRMSSCPPLWCLSPCWSSPCFLHCNRHTYCRDALILLPQLVFVANAETPPSPVLDTVVIKGSVKMQPPPAKESHTLKPLSKVGRDLVVVLIGQNCFLKKNHKVAGSSYYFL